MKPIVIKLGNNYIAYYPKHTLDNGWQPYNQPGEAYFPRGFEECERYELPEGAALLVCREKKPNLSVEKFICPICDQEFGITHNCKGKIE